MKMRCFRGPWFESVSRATTWLLEEEKKIPKGTSATLTIEYSYSLGVAWAKIG